MLGDDSHASYLVDVGYMKGLHAAVVFDVPDIDHSLCVTCDETLEACWAVDSDQRRLVAIELDDFLFPVWVPDEDLKIEAHTYQDLVAK
jgi:hypothetical protein